MSEGIPEVPPDVVRRAKAGDDEACEALIRAVYPAVRRWSLVQTGDPTEADDLTQDVLIRMIRRLDGFQGDAELGTWLYAITRNAAVDRFRKRARDARFGDDPDAAVELAPTATPSPDKVLQRKEMASVIHTFFEELPERQRQVFDLVELQGVPTGRVSELLEIEPVSVRAHLFKARRRMRERILAEHPQIAEDVR